MNNYGQFGPKYKIFPRLIQKISKAILTRYAENRAFYCPDSHFAKAKGKSFCQKLNLNETLYLVGIAPAGHNSGVALIEVSKEKGIRILSNHEEERFTGIKHCTSYPKNSIESLKNDLEKHNICVDDIHCVLASWDYVDMISFSWKTVFEHAPQSFNLLRKEADPEFNASHLSRSMKAPRRLGKQLGLNNAMPIIGQAHHGNHAYYSYAVSPFAQEDKPVMVTVLDGTGDTGAISLYLAKDGKLACLRQNQSTMDSLGIFYGFISATQGGWSFLSSEGRYMGAAAWGDMNRLTNPYYKRLRQIFYFAGKGEIFVNRKFVNWHRYGQINPYANPLIEILGEPIPKDKMWNPDAVLNVSDVSHSDITLDRVDKAAAVQLVFEDALFHIVDYMIRETKADRLVLTGGTALNCVANMRLLEHFNKDYYQRNLNQDTQLNIWVPPIPGDAGVALGSAFQFAMQNGAKPGAPLEHAFYCGQAPTANEIKRTIKKTDSIVHQAIGNINNPDDLAQIADFMAYSVSKDAIIGIYQGPAETGPRALGHRSILANPANPNTLAMLNERVKFREKIRPLAPMVTLEAAHELFELADGAGTADYNAYNYMVLTVPAKAIARSLIPAAVHHDGTSRIQIVRKRKNPLVHAYLKSLKQYIGVECSVNTSLNVGSPIVQTPEQAMDVLWRAKDLDGLLMITEEGDVFVVWRSAAVCDNQRLAACLKEWLGAVA